MKESEMQDERRNWRRRVIRVCAILLLLSLLIAGPVYQHVRAPLRQAAIDFLHTRTTLLAVKTEDIQAQIRFASVDRVLQSSQHSGEAQLLKVGTSGGYFTDVNGRTVYLTGSHTWLNLQDGGLRNPPAAFDYSQWLDFVQSQNLNFFRLWRWEQAKWSLEWPTPQYFAPQPFLRTGPGLALDGKPKFDLTKYDDDYFRRMRSRIAEAGRRGIYVSVMLFNGWSTVRAKAGDNRSNPWLGHPFHRDNNINGVDGDPNHDDSGEEYQELGMPALTALQDAYVRKVVDTVNDLDNVLYEISNESEPSSVAWQYHMIDLVHAYERTKPKQHPVGMTVPFPNGTNEDLYKSNADWISPKGDLNDPVPGDGRKVVIYDTDHLCGICGTPEFAWKAMTRGLNPVFMDRYNDQFRLTGRGYKIANQNDVQLRRNLGYARAYANRISLSRMRPMGGLSSTGYCLAFAGSENRDAEYLVYAPGGGQLSVDLSGTRGSLDVEWFDPSTGRVHPAGETSGGGTRSFKTPFTGHAVLYLRSVCAESRQEE